MLALAFPFAATALTTLPELSFTLQVISGGGMVVVDVLTLTALLIVGLGFAAIAVAGIGSLVRADRPPASAAEPAAGHAVAFEEPVLVGAAAPAA